MPIFKSQQPPINVPWHLPVWTWLFDSEYSPLRNYKPEEMQGYTNAVTKEHLSYADLKTHTTHLSTALVKKYGLQQGQTVALFSPNTVWYPCAMFGTLRAGGVVSGASPAYNVEEMSYALKTAEAKFLFTVPGSMAVAAAAAENAGIPRDHVFLLEGELEGFTTMAELLAIGRSYSDQGQIEPFKIPAGKKNKDICGFLSFSSGTTGLPKAVMIAHSNVIAQCLQIKQITPATLKRILAVLPLFHITGLVHQLHLPVILNANVYMLPSFSMDSMLATVQEYKLEEMLLVPPILIRMVRDEKTLAKYDLSSLKRFSSGAAPLSAEILNLLQKKFPGTGFKQGYGMTESCSCITAHPPEKYDYKYAFRVGTIVASTEVKIVDPATGKECGLNEPGEIWARGPQIVMGYLNNPRATAETFDQDGFLHTGDIGSIDEEGLITITDRLKEMIKVKGIGVAPAELEDLLLGHPDVEDVAVLGISDEYAGERPKAYVVLIPSKRSNPEQVAKKLIQYVQEKKVRHKWITEIEVVDEIPKSPSGKILRRVLRDMSKQGRKGVVVRDERERARL
ncbi:4-coumarate-CoA ligase 1 [Exophiala dermatitidis]|uniref:CoA ligase n=1 Tax=Exophiala dermatitidis (strain ATCC 34100 / CBS 525.76 / NIH/UT8656) TaxID=858893 RepID=H6C7Q7_EXODN|nr:CoA ligase [Exophiala dermatitidis NIH/UT8656]EHY58887.1 CoA ligase [Exophiala dermatitidis NIH/UT8656]